MVRLPAPLLLCLLAGAGACASAPTDLEGWPTATRAIRNGLELELDRLTNAALAVMDPAAASSSSAAAALRTMNEIAQPRLAAWRALEDHCGRVLPALREAPYDGRGVRTVAESWRLLVDALPDVSQATTEQRDEIARAMIRTNTTTSALQAADEAAVGLGEDLNLYHASLSDAVRAAGRELGLLLQSQEADLIAHRDALAEIIQSAETELRKEAAGAGVARPDAQARIDANRPELARSEEQLAIAVRARAGIAQRFESAAEHVKRTGFAAREWAVAQREAGKALRHGLASANFRLLQASAAELSGQESAAPGRL